jgi:hypothetical protein
MPSGDATLVLLGRNVLWTVAHATSDAIRALIAAATQVILSARDA